MTTSLTMNFQCRASETDVSEILSDRCILFGCYMIVCLFRSYTLCLYSNAIHSLPITFPETAHHYLTMQETQGNITRSFASNNSQTPPLTVSLWLILSTCCDTTLAIENDTGQTPITPPRNSHNLWYSVTYIVYTVQSTCHFTENRMVTFCSRWCCWLRIKQQRHPIHFKTWYYSLINCHRCAGVQ